MPVGKWIKIIKAILDKIAAVVRRLKSGQLLPDLSHLSRLERVAAAAAAASPTFEELEAQHPTVIKSLIGFSKDETSAIIAALLTCPALHTNTIRLEAL